MSNQEKPKPEFLCNYVTYGPRVSSHRCFKPAALASVISEWRNGEKQTRFAPRCKFHAAVDRNKKYSPAENVEITEAIAAEWRVERAAQAVKDAEKRAADEIKRAEANALALARETAEAAVERHAVRNDYEDYSFSSGRRFHLPRWQVAPSGWAGIEVKIDKPHEGFPVQLEVRNSSRLHVNEAKALIEALSAAVALIESGNPLFPDLGPMGGEK